MHDNNNNNEGLFLFKMISQLVTVNTASCICTNVNKRLTSTLINYLD